MWILLMLILTVYSYRDIREKEIPVWWLAMGLLTTMVWGIVCGMQETDLWSHICKCLCGMLPGVIFTLLAFLRKGSVGCGDGIVLSIIGGMAGIEYAAAIFLAAMLISFVYSCILIVVCKKNKKYCFPFIPFYLLGTVAVRVLEAAK